jgi:uncharacterized protein YndB with AHSA1/START domain
MTLVHDTIIVRRNVGAPVGEVFQAWAETSQLEAWCYPGDASWASRVEGHAFVVGGAKTVSFGPMGDPPYQEDARYLDIRPNRHLINSERILAGDGRLISTSLITVEFITVASGCELVITDQITLIDANDTPEQRRAGWNEVLDRLHPFLASGR